MTGADRLNRFLLTIGVFEWRWVRALFITLLRAVRGAAGDARARDILNRFGDRLVWSGWPFRSGWMHLHASRLAADVERAVWGVPPMAARPVTSRRDRPLKVGILADFHYTLGTQRPLFERVPQDAIELHLFDRGDPPAEYLAPYAASYRVLKTNTEREYADAITSVPLDLLLSIVPKAIAYRTFELIDTPCIAHVCTGSDLMHHPRVDYCAFTQPEFGYALKDGRVHCTFTGRPFGAARGYASWLVCDPRGLERMPQRSWAEREPLVAWHGSLYKLQSARFLDVIFDVLAAHPDVRFEYFGKGSQIAEIARLAARRGVADRVTHRGVAGYVRDAHGELRRETYADLKDTLSRARVWPDSFPIGGGSARFEAYAAGVPSIHMAPTADPPGGPYEDGSLLELPWLEALGSVARSRDEYRQMMERCLFDESFASALAAAQHDVVNQVSDAEAWWRHMRACYDHWSESPRA